MLCRMARRCFPVVFLAVLFAFNICVIRLCSVCVTVRCPPVVRLLTVIPEASAFLYFFFVLPLFSGMIRQPTATNTTQPTQSNTPITAIQYHPFLTVATPSVFRCCSVAVPLLEWTGKRPLFPVRCPFAVAWIVRPVRCVVSSFFRRFLRVCRLLDVAPVLTPKNPTVTTPPKCGYST